MLEPGLAEHPTLAGSWSPRTAEWLRQAPSRFAGKPDRPLFIGACPRSGTTLLRGMLNNHPDLAMPPETDFVIPVWRARPRWGDLRREENRRRLAEWIVDTPGRGGKRIIRRRFFSREQAIERMVAAGPTLGCVFAACFEMFAEAKGKQRWGDKRPRYAGFVDVIFQLFPDAQFINLCRDPRATVASQIPLGWNVDALASAVANWETALSRVDLFAPRLRPDQLLDLRYEDLVREPEPTLERVCEFAGLRAGEAIDDMQSKPRRGEFNVGWHDRVGEPISTVPIDSWRKKLEPEQVAFVEYATAQHFERLGYRALPGLDAEPTAHSLERLRVRRRGRRKKWRKYRLGEMKRRHVTYRHPVAAHSSLAQS